jgi:hypothetical protein
MGRRLIFDQKAIFQWSCSECRWQFKPEGQPTPGTLEQMTKEYHKQRDEQFAAHDCKAHPRKEK